MTTTRVNCATVRCLHCGRAVPEADASDESSLLVSVLLADEVTFDAVLLMHPDCLEDVLSDGVELLNVKALGHALILAAECAAQRRQSQAAERAAVRPMRPARSH